MKGSMEVRFSELFADTIEAHGEAWAYRYYVEKHGMPDWEWRVWVAGWHRAKYGR